MRQKKKKVVMIEQTRQQHIHDLNMKSGLYAPCYDGAVMMMIFATSAVVFCLVNLRCNYQCCIDNNLV